MKQAFQPTAATRGDAPPVSGFPLEPPEGDGEFPLLGVGPLELLAPTGVDAPPPLDPGENVMGGSLRLGPVEPEPEVGVGKALESESESVLKPELKVALGGAKVMLLPKLVGSALPPEPVAPGAPPLSWGSVTWMPALSQA